MPQDLPKNIVRRVPDRGHYDEATIHSVLDAGFLAHVGFAVEGQPFVIPMLYGRDGNALYLHGSAASRLMRQLDTGISACFTVTLVDGLVLARSAFNHSMNYRSVVAFGTARKVEGDEKLRGLEVVSDHLLRGRWQDTRLPSAQELKATTVLRFEIAEASAKIREGAPKDDDEDYALPYWAGVVPVSGVYGEPQPDPKLIPGIELPSYLPKPGSAR